MKKAVDTFNLKKNTTNLPHGAIGFFVNIKKPLALVLALVLILVFCPLCIKVNVFADSNTTIDEDTQALNELKNKLASIRDKKKNLENYLDNTSDEVKGILSQKYETEEFLTYYEEEIATTEEIVADYNNITAEAEEELSNMQFELDDKLEKFGQLTRYLYEYGTPSVLEMFFNADGFGDFLARIKYNNNLLKYNDKMIEEIQTSLKAIELKQSQYNEAADALNGYLEELRLTRGDYATKITELNAIVEELASGVTVTQEELDSYLESEKKFLAEISELQTQLDEKIEQQRDGYAWVFSSKISYRISSDYGWRNNSSFTNGKYEHHNGVDIVPSTGSGTPILAAAAGTVTRSEYSGSFGNVVVINHGNGISTLYCHCSSRLVKVGAKVLQSQVIAKVGTTGQSEGPHLHLAFIAGGDYVDPKDFFDARYFD